MYNLTTCLESTKRVNCKIPGWLVDALKVYFLECRKHFLDSAKLEKVKRQMEDEETWPSTENFFVNSKGTNKFRTKSIADQFETVVSEVPHKHIMIQTLPHDTSINIRTYAVLRVVMSRCVFQFEEDLSDPKAAYLRRKVADLLKVSFNPNKVLGKKKHVASYVHDQLPEGYTYKQVWREVGKRQDHQKYEKQQLRARVFRRMYSHVTSAEGVERWLEQCYKHPKNKWDTSDMKKVAEAIKQGLKDNTTRNHGTQAPDSTGIRYKQYDVFEDHHQQLLKER